LELEKSFTS